MMWVSSVFELNVFEKCILSRKFSNASCGKPQYGATVYSNVVEYEVAARHLRSCACLLHFRFMRGTVDNVGQFIALSFVKIFVAPKVKRLIKFNRLSAVTTSRIL